MRSRGGIDAFECSDRCLRVEDRCLRWEGSMPPGGRINACGSRDRRLRIKGWMPSARGTGVFESRDRFLRPRGWGLRVEGWIPSNRGIDALAKTVEERKPRERRRDGVSPAPREERGGAEAGASAVESGGSGRRTPELGQRACVLLRERAGHGMCTRSGKNRGPRRRRCNGRGWAARAGRCRAGESCDRRRRHSGRRRRCGG